VLQIGHDLPIREIVARINTFIDEHRDEVPNDDDDDDDDDDEENEDDEDVVNRALAAAA
jgi:hypothetical protein